MGNWAALCCHERDIGVEELWPFNNLDLLLQVLSIDPAKRKWPSRKFFKDLISLMWPEVLEEKINPESYRGLNYIKGLIKTRPNLALFAHKIRNFI